MTIRSLKEIAAEIERKMFYGHTDEEQARLDADRAAFELASRCKPCCDEHSIYFNVNIGQFCIDVDSEHGDMVIKFCPSCGKPPEREPAAGEQP